MDSQNWYLIDPQPTMNGGFESEEWDDWVEDSFDEALTETQLGEDVIFCSGQFDGETGLFETEFETKANVQNKTFDTYTQGWKRQLLTQIRDLVADYKYIKIKDSKGNWQIYVIMAMPDSNGIYTKAVVHECNYTLKWQDSETGIIYYYPSYTADATQYNTGVESVSGKIQTGYVQLMSWLSLDDITVELQRDKRMFIDFSRKHPDTFIITSMSKVPYSYNEMRIMRITFTECEYNPDVDRIDLKLCDYVDKTPPSDDKPINITYKGEPQVRIGGQKTFYTDKDATFELVVVPEFTDKVTLTIVDARTCCIQADFDRTLIGIDIRLKAYWHGRTAEQLVKVIGGV